MSDEGKISHNPTTTNQLTIRDTNSTLSYKKTEKLVMALYMVTDILDIKEPIRHDLRSLGSQLVTDTSVFSGTNYIGHIEALENKIGQIISLLNVASAVRMISEMNATILKQEFNKLQRAIDTHKNKFFIGASSLAEFIGPDEEVVPEVPRTEENERKKLFYIMGEAQPHKTNAFSKGHYKGHTTPKTTIGVQRADTLMKALSHKVNLIKDTTKPFSLNNAKKERREEIKKILKGHTKGLTISDIRNQSSALIKDNSEKTLQRELLAMVHDGTLRREGEKRWSRYILA